MPGTYRILIVDDEDDIRTIIRQALHRKYEVIEAYDGLDALQKLPIVEPDFVVMDIMMPLMDGFKACEAIKQHPQFREIPVLFLSALNTKTDMMKGYQTGAALYLTKPFDPIRLARNIDLHFESAKVPAGAKKHKIETVKTLIERLPEPSPTGSNPSGELPQPVLGVGSMSGASAAAPSPPPERAYAPSRAEAAPSAPVPRLLAVDDEEDIVSLIRIGLSPDFEVVTARDGIEAVERVVSYEPDIILIDALMPRMSGYQLCQSLRRNRRYQETPIIFLSGKASEKDKRYAERLGANDFFSKPFEVEDLREQLLAHCAKPEFKVYAKRLTLAEIEEREADLVRERELRERQRGSSRSGAAGEPGSSSGDEMRKFLRDELT